MSLVPTSTPLTHFKLLSFDVYGTLIDWEGGMYNAIVQTQPFTNLPSDHPLSTRQGLLEALHERERAIQKAYPSLEYTDVLHRLYMKLVEDYDLGSADGVKEGAETFSQSVGDWPCFPDTIEALNKLKKHYYLVPLTNSSPSTFGASLKGPFGGFEFSAYYLAADIGSYKPDLRNFDYLFEHVKEKFGVEKDQILHVAQSQYHDHAPAKKIGLTSVWVDRKGIMGTRTDEAEFAWQVDSMAEFAELVEKAWAA